jgi:hypothetical protein
VFLDVISQYLIIGGAILIILVAIIVLRNKQFGMKSHHKIQAVGLIGLTLVALIALIASLAFNQEFAALISVASAAVGAIGGFLSHKPTTPNRTILSPIQDKMIDNGKQLNFSIAGISTAGYNMNYFITFKPQLPETEKPILNSTTGEFSWTPGLKFLHDEKDKEFIVTFTVTDGMGGTDSRDMKIKVNKA